MSIDDHELGKEQLREAIKRYGPEYLNRCAAALGDAAGDDLAKAAKWCEDLAPDASTCVVAELIDCSLEFDTHAYRSYYWRDGGRAFAEGVVRPVGAGPAG